MSYSPYRDADESSPLLGSEGRASEDQPDQQQQQRTPLDPSTDPHSQFCMLIGVPRSDAQPDEAAAAASHARSTTSLYRRAQRKHRAQSTTYTLTAALSNTLLLSQVVLGATLTALGASESSHVLITVFGVFNTIIAGLVAYLKSRGQPMRARMFRDDLEHVVDEIENSEIMWLGITRGIHGYSEIDVDDKVSVRSEVARLTRLYEAAVRKNMQNNPDLYSTGSALDAITGLRARPGAGVQLPPAAAPAAAAAAGAGDVEAAQAAPEADPDESPATSKDAGQKDAAQNGAADGKGKDKSAAADASDGLADAAGSSTAGAAQSKDDGQDSEPAADPSLAKKDAANGSEGKDAQS